jgi:hypothetical protein
MVIPHNPTTKIAQTFDGWRYVVTCPGTGCDGRVTADDTRGTRQDAETAAITASGMHKTP